MRDSRGAGTFPVASAELSRLFTAVRRGKVLTVTGRSREPRSQLVREIGQRLSSNFYDGVAVVSMDRVFGVRDLTASLGCVPGMPFLPCGTTNAASWLAERDMLLVLDGCEHLASEALEWLRELLAAAPGLRVLAAGPDPLAFAPDQVHRL
ncbi:hypothetical protein ACE1OC_07080 [Streptomyces sp. DSM 116496]|uniref:hypothetical protein n=1 Tax=Streptomyces stoeckheimensis TaxID=3344656 RepID=UPI0038B2AE1F